MRWSKACASTDARMREIGKATIHPIGQILPGATCGSWASTRFPASLIPMPWRWNGGPAVLQSPPTETWPNELPIADTRPTTARGSRRRSGTAQRMKALALLEVALGAARWAGIAL